MGNNNQINILTKENILYSVIGALFTYVTLYLNSSRMGWAFAIVFLMFLYLQNKKLGSVLFLSLYFYRTLFINTKIKNSFSPFIFGKFMIRADWGGKALQMIDQYYLIYFFFVLFVYVVLEHKKLPLLTRTILIVIGLLYGTFLISYFGEILDREGLMRAIFVYGRLFLAIAFIPLLVPGEFKFIFKYTLFNVSVVQIFVFLVGWLPQLIFKRIYFSGDFITLTSNTATETVYITGIALMFLLFNNQVKYRNLLIGILLLIIFLAQSVAQTFVLFSSIIIVQVVFAKKKKILGYLVVSFFIGLLIVVFVMYSSKYFPYIRKMLIYADLQITYFSKLGILNNPKVAGFIKIFNTLSEKGWTNFLFGNGNKEFFQMFGRAEVYGIQYVNSSMGRTVFTPFNVLLYDYGFIPAMIFVSGLFYIFYKVKKSFSAIHSNYGLVALGVIIYVALSYLLFPVVEYPFTSIVAGTMIAGTFYLE